MLRSVDVARRTVPDSVRFGSEEVFAEGLTRNASAFARFFDALGFCHGQVLNFSNVARDCGVDAKTPLGERDHRVTPVVSRPAGTSDSSPGLPRHRARRSPATS